MTAAVLRGRRLYVYYKAAQADLPAIQAAALAMQVALMTRYPGLQAELLRRPPALAAMPGPGVDDPVAVVTLMEIYGHPAGVDEAMSQDIEREALCLRGWLPGGRHVEVFAALDHS